MKTLRSKLIRLASELPKGSPERKKLLAVLTKEAGPVFKGQASVPVTVEVQKIEVNRSIGRVFIESNVNGVSYDGWWDSIKEFKQAPSTPPYMDDWGETAMTLYEDMTRVHHAVNSLMEKAIAAYLKDHPEVQAQLDE